MAQKRKRKEEKVREAARLKSQMILEAGNRGELVSLRSTAPLSIVGELHRWIRSQQQISSQLFRNGYPSKVGDLEPRRVKPNSAAFELRWTALELLLHADRLNEFIAFKSDFESEILLSNFVACREILSKAEASFGQSFWLLSNRIALHQVSEGLEYQKAFTRSVIAESIEEGVVQFIAHHLSFRNELSVTTSRFSQHLERNLDVSDVPSLFRDFIESHLLPQRISKSQVAGILAFNLEVSIIDAYEGLLQVLRAIAIDQDRSLRSDAAHVIKILVGEVDDSRLRNLRFEFGGENGNPTSDTAVKTFEYFLLGEHSRAVKQGLASLSSQPCNFDTWEIVATAAAMSDESVLEPMAPIHLPSEVPVPLYRRLIESMSLLLRERDDDYINIYNELIKFSLNYVSHSWAQGLNGFLWEQDSPEGIASEDHRVRSSSLSHSTIHPLRLPFLGSIRDQERYLSELNPLALTFERSYEYADSVVSGLNSVSTNMSRSEGLLASAEHHFRKNEFAEVLPLAAELCEVPFAYFRYRGIKLAANSLIFLGLINDAVTFVSNTLIENPALSDSVPLEMLVELIVNGHGTLDPKSIYLPILFQFYSLEVSEQFDHLRNYRCEDFVLNWGVTTPSELSSVANKFDRQALLFYLHKVAAESNIDMFLALEDSRAVANERLKICTYLIELDPANTEEYQAEIKDINRRLMLQRRLREIEQSKIYVDIEKIKRKIGPSIKEGLNRYQAFLKHNLRPLFEQLIDRKSLVMVEGAKVYILSIPENEMTQILESMVTELRDEYVGSSESGLDAYLSVRIRHGTLRGQLRSPLEAAHLVTQRDSKTQKYKDNEHWTKTIVAREAWLSTNPTYVAPNLPRFKAEMNARFAEFSVLYDTLVSEISSEWIQVRRKPDDPGMFDFSFDRGGIAGVVSTQVLSSTTYDEFVDAVLEGLELRLLECLENIRRRLDGEFKQRATGLLDELHDGIDRVGQEFSVSVNDLTNAIRGARTSLLIAIDRVIQWFYLSKSTAREPFRLEDAIGVSEASVKTFSPRFFVELDVSEDVFPLKGDLLTGMVDIFFIIFENVVKHSGSLEENVAHVSLSRIENEISVVVDNPVAPDVYTSGLNGRLEDIKTSISEGRYLTAVSSEGGTGFYKIMKILKHDVGISAAIDFGFPTPTTFRTSLRMPFSLRQGDLP